MTRSKMKRANLWIAIGMPVAVMLVALAGWVAVLSAENVPRGPMALILPWPVVCTARGCLTTHDWAAQLSHATKFSESVKENAPSIEAALTSVVRRHLVENAAVGEPVTASDARRYREEILHLKDEALLKEAAGLTLAQYDELVVVPFLQQAALQQQYKAETLEELYATLAQEHAVLVLPFHFRWDKDTGTVVRR